MSSSEGLASETPAAPPPADGAGQLTFRAVAAGCLLGGLVSGINLMLGLRIGWTLGGSIIAAILGYALFYILQNAGILRRPYTLLEANITQTAGSAAGSMTSAAGLVAAIPALGMMGTTLSWWQLMLWAASIAYLGVFFAVPLRRQMVVVEKLRFPTGTATAETLSTMFASGDEAIKKAKALLTWLGIAFGVAILGYFVPEIMDPMHILDRVKVVAPSTYEAAGLIGLAIPMSIVMAYTFSLSVNLVLGAAGILIGPRVGTSLLLGAIVSWGILAPVVVDQGWAAGPWIQDDGTWTYGWLMKFDKMPETMLVNGEPHPHVGLTGARAWLLWPGVAIMVAEALTAVALNWRSVLGTFTMFKSGGEEVVEEDESESIPTLWWVLPLLGSTALAAGVAQYLFGIPWWLTVIAVALSSILATIAVRSTGETDINPIGGMGKITQIVFAGLAPGVPTTNLMAAAVTGAGASQAGDMMQDLKTGYMLGASPRKQFIAQIIGIAAGIVVCVPAYIMVDTVYDIGGLTDPERGLPAPAAFAWKGMAELLATGVSGLPEGSLMAVVGGLILGTALPVLRSVLPESSKLRMLIPSGLAFGIAFIVEAKYSVIMFLGAMVLVYWQKRAPEHCNRLAYAVASGIIAGGALFDLLLGAPLMLLGVGNIWDYMVAWGIIGS